jgi:hypothetical protein
MVELKFKYRSYTGNVHHYDLQTIVRDVCETEEGHANHERIADVFTKLMTVMHDNGLISHTEITKIISLYEDEYEALQIGGLTTAQEPNSSI